MKYLFVIPAREGSKGLRFKNIQPLNGRSLIHWTIRAAFESGMGDVLVSTESQMIIDNIVNAGFKNIQIIKRAPELSEDDVPLAPVIVDAYKQANKQDRNYSAVITLQPTSPLRDFDDIRRAVGRYERSGADSLLSVCEDLHSIWERKLTGEVFQIKARHLNRQEESPLYIANGAIFITSIRILEEKKQRIAGKVELFPMSVENSIDIHNADDIELAEFYLNRRRLR